MAGPNIDVSAYEVIVNKVTNNYSIVDPDEQTFEVRHGSLQVRIISPAFFSNLITWFQIDQILFSARGYEGDRDFHAADIAIIVLKKPIPFTGRLYPACIDVEGLMNQVAVPPGTIGRVNMNF